MGQNASSFPANVERENIVCPEYIKKAGESKFLPVEAIGEKGFYNCTSMKTIKLPKTLKTVMLETFKNSGIVELDLPEKTVVTRGAATDFIEGCSNLKRVIFRGNFAPDDGCSEPVAINFLSTGLEEIVLANGARHIFDYEGTYMKYPSTFSRLIIEDPAVASEVYSGENYVLPNTLNQIYIKSNLYQSSKTTIQAQDPSATFGFNSITNGYAKYVRVTT